MSETEELASKLARRQALNNPGENGDQEIKPQMKVFNAYTEFPEFSRNQIKEFEGIFKKYDVNGDKLIDLTELKVMMEKLGAPQTHIGLKGMIAEVDEDQDGSINLREFLLIFRKAKAGELAQGTGLSMLAELTEIDVSQEGVGGAKNFFEDKIRKQSRDVGFEAEIKAEQELKRKEEEERKARKAEFKAKAAAFSS